MSKIPVNCVRLFRTLNLHLLVILIYGPPLRMIEQVLDNLPVLLETHHLPTSTTSYLWQCLGVDH